LIGNLDSNSGKGAQEVSTKGVGIMTFNFPKAETRTADSLDTKTDEQNHSRGGKRKGVVLEGEKSNCCTKKARKGRKASERL
jgi:hypothetical protein